jgi:hypothetical protein
MLNKFKLLIVDLGTLEPRFNHILGTLTPINMVTGAVWAFLGLLGAIAGLAWADV